MENSVKKRNSILRKVCPQEETKTPLVRTNRKISFNRRASVREFIPSEETKAWDNSYDVSDTKNNSEETAGEKTIHKNFTKTAQLDSHNKENIDVERSTNRIESCEKYEDICVDTYASLSDSISEQSKQNNSNKQLRGNFSFTVIEYEMERFQQSKSLSIEPEQTSLFRRELERYFDAANQLEKPLSDVRNTECDMDITENVHTENKNKVIYTSKQPIMNMQHKTMYFNEDVENTHTSPIEKLMRKTLHLNEDIEQTTLSTDKPKSFQEQKHFILKSETSKSMDMSLTQQFEGIKGMEIHRNTSDVSMKELSFGKNGVDMEVTEVAKPAFENALLKDDDFVVLKDDLQKVNCGSNDNTKYFDESLGVWNIEDSRKDSTTLLANASLESDPTLHEYMKNTKGGKLNFLQLNEEFEKGHIKVFSHTPEPKKFNTPKKNGLLRFQLFNDSNSELNLKSNREKVGSAMQIVSDVTIEDERGSPRTNTLSLTPFKTPMRSINSSSVESDSLPRSFNEFEGLEKQSYLEPNFTNKNLANMQLENTACIKNSQEITPSRNIECLYGDTPASTSPGAYTRRHTVVVEKEMLEKSILSDDSEMFIKRRQSVHASKNMSVERVHKNKRVTILAAKDMLIDENTSAKQNQRVSMLDFNDILDNGHKKNVRRQTVLATQEMTLDESLSMENGDNEGEIEGNFSVFVSADMTLEPLSAVKHVEAESQKRNKRITITANQQMELEKLSAAEESIDKRSPSRMTINQYMDIEQKGVDEHEDEEEEQEEIETETKEFLMRLKSIEYNANNNPSKSNMEEEEAYKCKDNHKRLTITSNQEMELEDDDVIENDGYELNCSVDEIEEEQAINNRNRLTISTKQQMDLEKLHKIKVAAPKQKRMTFLANESMVFEAEKEKTVLETTDMIYEEMPQQFPIGRAAKHKRYTIRDSLDLSIESNSSPVCKKSNLGKNASQFVTPKRSTKSMIPVLVSSTKKPNYAASQIINLDDSLDTIPVPRHLFKASDKSVIEINDDCSLQMPKFQGEPSVCAPAISFANTTVANILNYMHMSGSSDSLIENECLSLNLSSNIMPPEKMDDELETSIISLSADTCVTMSPTKSLPDVGLNELKRLLKKPRLFDVLSQFRRISLDLPWNFNDFTSPSANNTIQEPTADDDWFAEFKNNYSLLTEKFESEQNDGIRKSLCCTKVTGVDRFCQLLNEVCSSWIINKQMQLRKMLQLKHSRLPHVAFTLIYAEQLDLFEDIEIQKITKKNELFTVNWKPIDHVIDFQLKLELPYDIRSYYKCNDVTSFCECLCTLDQICQDVLQLCICMWRILCEHDAQLIRIGVDTYVQKYVRRLTFCEKDEIPDVQTIEYRIELRHLRKICYKNIVMPRLHVFREELQLLPTGLDFLIQFLVDPEKYIK